MTPRFAVTAQGEDGPNAIFRSSEDAQAWATLRYGHGNFRVDEVRTEPLSVARQAEGPVPT